MVRGVRGIPTAVFFTKEEKRGILILNILNGGLSMSRLTDRTPYWLNKGSWTSVEDPDDETIDDMYVNNPPLRF